MDFKQGDFMGQYYTAIIKNLDDKYKAFYSMGVLKLTEHSYFDNALTNEICRRLVYKTHRLAWVGDYAEISDLTEYMDEEFLIKEKKLKGTNVQYKPFNWRKYIIVNLSKKEKITLNEYYERINDEWCLHPLPILTCIGNGKGGGDYFSSVGQEYIGYWAQDEIMLVRCEESSNYKDYEEIKPDFKEEY